MRINPAALLDLGKMAVRYPEFQERDITGDGRPETFCNFNVATVARVFGYVGFYDGDGRPYSANQICGFIECSSDWRAVDYAEAQRLQNEGALVVYYREAAGHGHVSFGVPGALQESGTYGGLVPKVANIGPARYTGLVKLSEAFGLSDGRARPKCKVYDPQPILM